MMMLTTTTTIGTSAHHTPHATHHTHTMTGLHNIIVVALFTMLPLCSTVPVPSLYSPIVIPNVIIIVIPIVMPASNISQLLLCYFT